MASPHHAGLVCPRAAGGDQSDRRRRRVGKRGVPDLIPLTLPEVRHLLLALDADPARQRHHLAWSRFRRHHQAGAKRRHTARRATDYDPAATPPLQRLTTLPGDLTDDAWALIARLLPPAKTTGRPRADQRRVLDAILWVMRSGSAWHDLPADFGAAATVYHTYSRWRKAGIWTKILAVLTTP